MVYLILFWIDGTKSFLEISITGSHNSLFEVSISAQKFLSSLSVKIRQTIMSPHPVNWSLPLLLHSMQLFEQMKSIRNNEDCVSVHALYDDPSRTTWFFEIYGWGGGGDRGAAGSQAKKKLVILMGENGISLFYCYDTYKQSESSINSSLNASLKFLYMDYMRSLSFWEYDTTSTIILVYFYRTSHYTGREFLPSCGLKCVLFSLSVITRSDLLFWHPNDEGKSTGKMPWNKGDRQFTSLTDFDQLNVQ